MHDCIWVIVWKNTERLLACSILTLADCVDLLLFGLILIWTYLELTSDALSFCVPSLAPGSKSKCKCVVFTFNNKRSTQFASVRMEHAYSRSVFFQTITHWALGLKTAKSRDRPVPLPHQNTHRSIHTHN
jgi:hypothetical protein